MFYKCDLMVNGYVYNVSNHLMNWDDIIVSYKRNDYDGVIRSFSTKFEFVNVAYSLLKDEYRKKYLGAQAIVVISLRNNSWTWNEIFRCALDFSTFSDDGNVISINAIDNSLASLIKAKKGTQYEYSVDAVGHELASLYYDRIAMSNIVRWTVGGNSNDLDGSVSFDYSGGYANPAGGTIPLYITHEEISANKKVEYKDLVGGKLPNPTNGFLDAIESVSVKLEIDLQFKANTSNPNSKAAIMLYNRGVLIKDMKWWAKTDSYTTVKAEVIVSVLTNSALTFHTYLSSDSSSEENFTIIFKKSTISCTWLECNENKIYINVVPPVTLLNRLLKSMNGGKDGYTGTIASGVDPRLDNCMLVAAESIRGIPNAKIYSSYSKFVNWMSTVFGFVPVIGDNSVSFVHRDSLFRKVVLKELGDMVNDFEYSVNRSLIYSRLRVGYDKQDYDSINGRDEFRFANTFSTGQSLTDNALELISPYRADVYGIEFLAQKRGKDTTDNESDNDVFFVGAKLKTVIVGPPGHGSVAIIRYELIRGYGGYNISGVISPDTMFNAMYSPRSMIMANKKFIGCSTESLIFASSDGNSDVVINGVKESDDIIIEDRLFTVGELSFSTSDNEVLNDWSGEISIEKGGEAYQGYVMDTKINSLKSKEVKYTLIVESIK